MCKIHLSGYVNSKGDPVIYEKNDLKRILSGKKGKKFDMVISMHEVEKSKEYLGYYWGVAIPRIREAWKQEGTLLSKTSCEMKCRRMCECYEETPLSDGTGYRRRLRGVSEMGTSEFYDYIERLKILVAEVLNVYIEDPISYHG